MRNIHFKAVFFIFLAGFFGVSCSVVSTSHRADQDHALSRRNYQLINGDFLNKIVDSSKINTRIPSRSLWYYLSGDTLLEDDTHVNVFMKDQHTLQITLRASEQSVSTHTLRGRFRKGYFKVNRQWKASSLVGPFFWLVSNNSRYIGLQNNDRLVIMSSSGRLLMMLALPVFSAGAQREVDFGRMTAKN